MPTTPPADASWRVTARSSADGVGSPEGWLCTRRIAAALSAMACRNTSRGWTTEPSSTPRVTVSSRVTACCVFSSSTRNSSWARSRMVGAHRS